MCMKMFERMKNEFGSIVCRLLEKRCLCTVLCIPMSGVLSPPFFV